MCMFKHFLDVNEEGSDNEDCDNYGDDDDALEAIYENTLLNPSQLEEYSLQTFKYMVSAPC